MRNKWTFLLRILPRAFDFGLKQGPFCKFNSKRTLFNNWFPSSIRTFFILSAAFSSCNNFLCLHYSFRLLYSYVWIICFYFWCDYFFLFWCLYLRQLIILILIFSCDSVISLKTVMTFSGKFANWRNNDLRLWFFSMKVSVI